MIKLLAGMFADRLVEEVKARFVFVNPLIRNVAFGAALILASFALWSVSFLLVFLTLFFYFADLPQYVLPAVWTALAGFGVSAAVTGAGICLIFRPIK